MCVDASKMVDRTIAGVKKNPLGLMGAWMGNPWVSALGSAHQDGKK